ncbi:MAG: YgiT-type zinc finger protein [bacterium]
MVHDHCEHCRGTVREQILAREIFRHKDGLVILENVPVGVCDQCGRHYYGSKVLHQVDQIAKGHKKPERTESVSIAVYR